MCYWKAKLYAMCRQCAEDAFKIMCRNPYAELYLYYFPAMNGQWGDIVACEDQAIKDDDGWELVRPERISNAVTVDTLTYWIHESIGGTPLIGD
jgi:hypothetical protein